MDNQQQTKAKKNFYKKISKLPMLQDMNLSPIQIPEIQVVYIPGPTFGTMELQLLKNSSEC